MTIWRTILMNPANHSTGEIQTTTSQTNADSTDCPVSIEKLIDAMQMCGWYNGLRPHIMWLIDYIKTHIENHKGYIQVMRPDRLNYDYGDFIEGSYAWMLCVCMFGDYGTSPRYGWIEKPEEAIKFLESILPDPDDDENEEDINGQEQN